MKKKNFFSIFVSIFLAGSLLGLTMFLLNGESTDIRKSATSSDKASITIDPNQEIYTLTKSGGNLHLAMLLSLDIGNSAKIENYNSFLNVIKNMGLEYFRFPAGCDASGYNLMDLGYDDYPSFEPLKENMKFDKVIKISQDTQTKLILELSVIGLIDEPGGSNPSHEYIDPCGRTIQSKWTSEQIKFFVIKYKDNVDYYELGNEEWGVTNKTLQRPITPGEYVNAAVKASKIIKENDPNATIIGVSNLVRREGYNGENIPGSENLTEVVWGTEEYKKAYSDFDYLTMHHYWHNYQKGMEEGESLFSNDISMDFKLDIYETLFIDYPKFITPDITEWNYLCWAIAGSNGPHPNTQRFEHTLYTIYSMLYLYERNISHPLIYHCILINKGEDIQDCGSHYRIGDTQVTTSATYGLELIEKYFADTHVKTQVNSPQYQLVGSDSFSSILASSSKEGSKIYTIILNRNLKESINTDISVLGMNSFKYYAYLLDAPALNSKKSEIKLTNIVDNKSTEGMISINIPSTSVIFLEIEGESICTPNCDGKSCGDDGCGGSCGSCSEGYTCVSKGVCAISGVNPDIAPRGNSDGKVNIYDLSMVITNWKWRYEPRDDEADINNDGKVDIYDLSLVITYWTKK